MVWHLCRFIFYMIIFFSFNQSRQFTLPCTFINYKTSAFDIRSSSKAAIFQFNLLSYQCDYLKHIVILFSSILWISSFSLSITDFSFSFSSFNCLFSVSALAHAELKLIVGPSTKIWVLKIGTVMIVLTSFDIFECNAVVHDPVVVFSSLTWLIHTSVQGLSLKQSTYNLTYM